VFFTHNSKEFVQKVVVLKETDYFTLKFYLVSQTGEEIFLKFFNTNNKKDWFYTFNTADVIKRHQFEKRNNCYGENGFPVVGALLIDYKSTFAQIYPKFPFGAHMPKTDYFELHLHRNPAYDDVLGLGSALHDKVPVEHEFLFKFGELNSTKLWQTYLSNKHEPHVFVIDNEEKLNFNLEKAENFKTWKFDTHYLIGSEDPCTYLSRVFFKKKQMVMSILNTCEYSDKFELNGVSLGYEVQADGYPLTAREANVLTEGELVFTINKNTPDTLWKYYKKAGKLSPFGLYSFTATLNNTQIVLAASPQTRIFTKIDNGVIINQADNSMLILSVLILFGISVVIVLILSVIKLKSTKKLD
jgi:hypothetical protein